MENRLRKVFVEASVRETAMTRRVLERVRPDAAVEIVSDAQQVLDRYASRSDDIDRGKRALLLTDFRGEAIKPCPATKEYLCCEYEILNFGAGCPLDCSYCILQGYFSNPLLVVQANVDAFFAAATRRLRSEPDRHFRMGSGEFADSLALDPLTDYARLLVEFARDFENVTLELKTKAACVDGLMGLEHKGRTVCAWSVNSEVIAREEEFGAAPLGERLAAARRCCEAGYRIAFHFDPIIHYPGWEDGYRETVRRLFEAVPPAQVAWISLGCFRYPPGLEQVIRRRFPGNRHTYGEFVPGMDNKMRYPQPLRVAMYRKMMQWIREWGGEDPFVYFCMENARVWSEVMGRVPCDNAELKGWLDARCRP